MGREERKELVFETLDDTAAALPLRVLSRNVKLRGGRFEESSCRRYLRELHEEGRVVKVDSDALDDRKLTEIDPSERGYWITCQLFRKRAISDVSDTDN
jgi:hypothetical protein